MVVSFTLLAEPSAAEGTSPLPLPPSYNPALNMISQHIGKETFHAPRSSARFVEELLSNGTPEDIARAELVLPGVLSGQITDPADRYYGAFRWELEMEAVEDLNAVQFLLYSLIPITVDHGDVLQPATVAALRESVRIGLINVATIDVGLDYTNIVTKDIFNRCIGGQLLGDATVSAAGKSKLRRWIAFTDESGGPYEYNSLPYTAVAMEVLSRLIHMTTDEEVRVLAQLMQARFAAASAVRLHESTGRWAGPHSRAYHGSVVGQGNAYLLQEREADSFRAWAQRGGIPAWNEDLMALPPGGDQVFETTGRAKGVGTSTYLTPDYALGVAVRNAFNQRNRFIAWQSNVFTLHYSRPGHDRAGSIYTRYLTDDRWLGWFAAGIGRGTGGLLPDEGHFQGVQDGERAIALYAPQEVGARHHHSGAKSVLVVPRWDARQDEVWVGSRQITALPANIPPGETIVIATGDVLLGLRPLTLTNLGMKEAQIQLKQIDDSLVLELINYRGPAKTFWELAWPGAFYQGQPQNGFYAETARRSDHDSPADLAAQIDRGELIDEAAPPFTFTGTETRPWKVQYARDGRTVGIAVDLMDWFRPAKRWTHEGELGFPMLESQRVRQSREGTITVGNVTLTTRPGDPAWLAVPVSGDTLVAAYHGPSPSPITIEGARGKMTLPSVETALITWGPEGVQVNGIGVVGEPTIE